MDEVIVSGCRELSLSEAVPCSVGPAIVVESDCPLCPTCPSQILSNKRRDRLDLVFLAIDEALRRELVLHDPVS